MCAECLANRTDRPFTDTRVDAAWRLTEEQRWDFDKGRHMHTLPPLLSSPVFSDLSFVVLDLGVTAFVFGSIVS